MPSAAVRHKQEVRAGALALSPEDRLELVEEIWESLESEELPLYDWQREILDRRLADLEAGRETTSPWVEARARLWPAGE